MSYETTKARWEASTPGEWRFIETAPKPGRTPLRGIDADDDPVFELDPYSRPEDLMFAAYAHYDIPALLDVAALSREVVSSLVGVMVPFPVATKIRLLMTALAKFEALP